MSQTNPLAALKASCAALSTGQAQQVTRAAFLRGTLTTLAGAFGSQLLPRPLSAQPFQSSERVGPALSPLDLEFTIAEQVRPFSLLPRRFVQLRDWFDGDAAARWARMALTADAPAAEISNVGPALRLRSASAAPTLFRTDIGPVAPYATVLVTAGLGSQGSVGEATVMAGLMRDANRFVVASFTSGGNPAQGQISLDLAIGERRVRVASALANLTPHTRFAFVLNENYVTALVGDAANWTPVVQHRITDLIDLRDPAVLGEYRYGFGVGGVNATVDVTQLEAGYFGQAGLRDPHVVSASDGTPYIRDGKLYFTATQAGLAFFQAAHWGVWTLDLSDPSRIEPAAQLFFARDGLVLGDHAGQIVMDERDGGVHLAVSSWGDFAFKGVHVRYVRTSADVLSGVHVLQSERMPLPTELSTWDPAMVRVDDRWHVGFVESPYQDPVRGFHFRPALARSDAGGPVTELNRVGADLSRGQTEGVILQKIGGRWYLLASDGAERRYRVYDLEMRFLGALKAPYGTNIPHPQIVPISEGGQTSYLLLTFNGAQYHENTLGYGTHGDFVVMRAKQTVLGHEFSRG
jgi:hypothetical protein